VICSSVPCDNIEGFATVSVAPDGSSITITIQVTALSFSSAIPTFLMAGIYGPARSHEEMPAGTKPLVEIAIPSVALSESTWTGVFRRTAADMPALLALMRTGQTYLDIATDRVPEGELRGQIEVGHCLETPLHPAVAFPEGYGATAKAYAFANVMLNPMKTKLAVLMQLPQDPARRLSSPVLSSVSIIGGSGHTLVVLQPQGYESCVAGTFDGRQADGVTGCNLDERHAYVSDVTMANSGTVVYKVMHSASAAMVADLHNASRVVIQTPKSIAAGYPSEVEGMLAPAIACRQLMTVHDSLYTLATSHRSDWISTWSMNDGNPDVRPTLEPRYYAHPLMVTKGETAMAIERRFGMPRAEILVINPGLANIEELPVGGLICVIPNWRTTIAGNGQRICIA